MVTLARLGLAGRILVVTALIGAVVMVVCGLALIGNARTAIAVEVAANRGLSHDYVVAEIEAHVRDRAPPEVIASLAEALVQPRHARVTIIDRTTGDVHVPRSAEADEEGHAPAPDWFRALLAPPVAEVAVPIRVGDEVVGDVMIRADPFDEIDEIWQDFRALAVIGMAAYAVMLFALWLVVRRALRPLSRMTEGIERFGAGDFAARIGVVDVPDLAPLARCFDELGTALQHTVAEKDALNRKLVRIQDEERKAIARELHDEFGPCLFGLKVEARSIAAEAKRRGIPGIIAGTRAIFDIVGEIEATNQALLQRLRPMELGQLPLSQVLEDLSDGMRVMAPEIDWKIEIAPDLDLYDETTELTIYRVAQEALTNALRHADAERIAFTAHSHPSQGGWAELVIEDDGKGLPPEKAAGGGLRGMRERIESVAGRISLNSAPGRGLRVCAEIPLEPRKEPGETA